MGFLEQMIGLDQEKVVPLTEVQAKRLVLSAKNKRDRLIFLIVLNSGIGINELLNMRLHDIDFNECEITIYGKDIRNIKMSPGVLSEIKEFLGPDIEDRLIFPIKQDALNKILKAYSANWRVLRHTYTDLAIRKKERPEVIANNVGVPLAEILSAYQYYNPSRKEGGAIQVI